MESFQEAKKAFGDVVRYVNHHKPGLNDAQRQSLTALYALWKNQDPMTLGNSILQLNSHNGRLTNSSLGSTQEWKEYVKKSGEIYKTMFRMAQEMQKKMHQ